MHIANGLFVKLKALQSEWLWSSQYTVKVGSDLTNWLKLKSSAHHMYSNVFMKKRLLALMEEASEEHHLSASGRIRWSSNILIGSIPLKKSLFSLITLMFGLEQRGQFHLFTPSLSSSPSPRLNKLAQQLIYTKQTQPLPQKTL